ncbi:MAG: HAD family hydrolase [Gammaproteobacteria bacterium]|nr:HAD family hydrolase [Gammaproteobacteria bacterium]
METSHRQNKIAIFDLDNTLIGGDSDYSWGQFLVREGAVDARWYAKNNEKFYQDYREGNLDIDEFLRFALRPLSEHSTETLLSLRDQFIAQCIEPLILPRAENLVAQHRASGHHLLIITATNRFIAEPTAQRLGITNLLATEPEVLNGRFTGRVEGLPCFQAGKIQHFRNWLSEQKLESAETWFYTDSHNDLPMLNEVDHPIAVDPDEQLASVAKLRSWPQISLR